MSHLAFSTKWLFFCLVYYLLVDPSNLQPIESWQFLCDVHLREPERVELVVFSGVRVYANEPIGARVCECRLSSLFYFFCTQFHASLQVCINKPI